MQRRTTRKPIMIASSSEQTLDDSRSDEQQSLRRTSRYREDVADERDWETITSSVRRGAAHRA